MPKQALLCPGEDPATLYACRPGEAMRCVHALQGADGCGTSAHCRICGAVNAVLKSLRSKVDMQQCSIHTHRKTEPLEFILLSMPLRIHYENFVLVSIFHKQDTQNLASKTFAIQRMAAEIENN